MSSFSGLCDFVLSHRYFCNYVQCVYYACLHIIDPFELFVSHLKRRLFRGAFAGNL